MSRIAIAGILVLAAVSAVAPSAAAGPLTIYGTRQPITCHDAKATDGPPSAEVARDLVICAREGTLGGVIFLLKTLNVEVATTGRQYSINTDLMNDYAQGTLIYPIRGSYTQYQCHQPMAVLDNIGRNCSETDVPQALGKCYVTGFGDWKCDMTGDFAATRTNMPPPQ